MDDAPSPAPPVTETAWPRSVQRATVLLALLAGALLLWQFWSARGGSARPSEGEPEPALADRLDLNTAGAAELTQLPGVGPTLAGRIAAHREQHGPFARVDDLGQVPGVSAALLVRLRPYLAVDGAVPPDPADPPAPEPAHAARPAKKPPAAPVDLNTAPEELLRTLPGIGDKTARAIVEERNRRPFASLDDLARVRGLGPKTRDKLRPHVTLTPADKDAP